MLSSAPIEGGLKMILEAGIGRIREKSLNLTSYLMYLIDETLSEPPYNFSIETPREQKRRGGHVGVEHKEAFRINEALKARGVILDFRPPNVIRLAPIPLYTRYHDVWMVVKHLRSIIDNREYERFPQTKGIVT